ncbi:MAG: acyltransferase [Sphingomonas sp.]
MGSREAPLHGPWANVTETSMSDASRTHLIAPLTSLRFFAAAAVVILHSGSHRLTEIVPRPIATLMANGYLGVTFFFVLSGFILQHVYAGKVDVRRYAVARFARIYPVYMLALAIAAVCSFSATWRAIPQLVLLQLWVAPSTTFDNWNGQAWTLSVELLFYMLFPLVSPIAARLRLPALIATVATLTALILAVRTSWISSSEQLAPALQWLPIPIVRLPEFLFGIALGETFNRGLKSPVPPSLFAASILAVLAFSGGAWTAAFATLLSGALIFSVATSKGLFVRVLSAKPLTLLGGASYALYLLAGPVRMAFHGLGLERWLALFLPTLLALSLVVFIYYEEKLREAMRHRAKLPDSAHGEIVAGA